MFIIHKGTTIINTKLDDSVMVKATELLLRDIKQILMKEETTNQIQLKVLPTLSKEKDFFEIKEVSDTVLEIIGTNSRAVMYGVLAISREFLGVDDNWYFLDTRPIKKETVLFDEKKIKQPLYQVKYRGWFINDEVMISEWKDHNSSQYVWERIFETLLRNGGNLIIPGTDENSHLNRQLASKFGLIITHHHAEPLGASMFARTFPDLEASYLKYPALFKQIWQEGIKKQHDSEVIWTLGFRGQGDRPFWLDDTSKIWTDQDKADVINEVIGTQYSMVKAVYPDAICAVNIYGEMTELYNLNLLELPADVIEIWADNGYGKMVSRRQGNEDNRAPILDNVIHSERLSGIYYHAAFHDLQASNFLTKLPNSPEFVSNELMEVRKHQLDTLVLVNTGNIKPHILFLSEIAKFWQASYHSRTNEEILSEYMRYYPVPAVKEVQQQYQELFKYMIQYGIHGDQKAGDEFYTYTTRKIIQASMRKQEKLEEMEWLTGDIPFSTQIEAIKNLIIDYIDDFEKLYENVIRIYWTLPKSVKIRFYNDLILDVVVHYFGMLGLLKISEGALLLIEDKYVESFLHVYDAKKAFEKIIQYRAENPSDKWRDFYKNDVFTNINLTIRMLSSFMQYIRILDDNHEQYDWERKYLMLPGESKVMLLSNKQDAILDDVLAQKIHYLIE